MDQHIGFSQLDENAVDSFPMMRPVSLEENTFSCDICQKVIRRKYDFNRHKLMHDKKCRLVCGQCGHAFSRSDHFQRHLKGYTCKECQENFCKKIDLRKHIGKQHASSSEIKQESSFNPYSEKVKLYKRKDGVNKYSTVTFDCIDDNATDVFAFLNDKRGDIQNELMYQMHKMKDFKCGIMLIAIVNRVSEDEESEFATLYLDSNTVPVFSEELIPLYIDQAFAEIIASYEQFLQIETQCIMVKIMKLNVNTTKYNLP